MRPIGCVVILAACAHNVPQDLATGGDGRQKGATPLVFDNGEARARGIVTYPGGDRVDWKKLQLPEGKRGKLDLQLTWQAPRPGLQVAFDVFDQWNTPVVVPAAHHRRGHTRQASIDHARGSYFVRIYAPNRGDAGAYKLVASFAEDPTPIVPDPSKLAVSDPPKLPAVPPPDPVCDTFEISNDACRAKCPDVGAPPGWPGCIGKPAAGGPATPPVTAPPAQPAVVTAPVLSRVLKVEVISDGVQVTIAAGSDQGITTKWRGQVLAHDTDHPLTGGSLTILRVGMRVSVARTHLTSDQINQNPAVRLTPP